MLRRVLLAAALVAAAVGKESKDCDPKKDSGCNKFIRPFYPNECWATWPGGPNCTRYLDTGPTPKMLAGYESAHCSGLAGQH